MAEILEQRGIVSFLLYLLRNEGKPLSVIVEEAGINRTTVYNVINRLLQTGLIKEDYEKGFPRRRIFRLTEKGRKVAEKLLEIEELMKG